jgi:hypothetical protein
VVSSLDQEQETMTMVTPLAHARATLKPTHSAPLPASDRAISRQFAICNALRMALHHVQRPDATPQDLSAATARANRALTLLKHACAESAATSGRA